MKTLCEYEFTLEKETPGTVRYQRQTDTGRKETQYVPKSLLGSDRPETITVTISVPED